MCRAFQPFTMQGIYFSLCASTQIKYIPFIFVSYRAIAYKVSKNTASLKNHFCLLQSHCIQSEQKHRFAKKPFFQP